MIVDVPQKDGSVHWKYVIRRKGHKTLSKTYKRKIDAEKAERKILTAMDEGAHVAQIKTPTYKLFEKFRDEVCPTRDGCRWEKTRINKLIREASWMQLPLSQADADQLQEWKIKRNKEVGDSSVNRELNLISGVFTHAIKEWRIKLPSNPIRGVSRPPKTKDRKRRIQQWEIDAIWEQRSKRVQTVSWYIPVMFEFAIETGLRVSELARLRWVDVNWNEKWIYVLPGKNGEDRYTPTTIRALELLRMLPQEGGRVFPVGAGSLDKMFREMRGRTSIVDLHFHDSRHEAVSRLAKQFPILQLAAIIGHKDLKSLLVYYNPTPAELAAHLHGDSQSKLQRPLPTT